MNYATALDLALQLIVRAAEASQIVARMKAEARDELTPDEEDTITAAADLAHDHLVQAIERAAREGR